MLLCSLSSGNCVCTSWLLLKVDSLKHSVDSSLVIINYKEDTYTGTHTHSHTHAHTQISKDCGRVPGYYSLTSLQVHVLMLPNEAVLKKTASATSLGCFRRDVQKFEFTFFTHCHQLLEQEKLNLSNGAVYGWSTSAQGSGNHQLLSIATC